MKLERRPLSLSRSYKIGLSMEPTLVSLIIPAYNEKTELPATLRATHAAASRACCNYEIVVVDDASTDGTAEIARELGARVVPVARRQIAAARNAGARAARGNVFVFLDADTHIQPEHITGALHALSRGYAGGGARVLVRGKIPLWAQTLLHIFSLIYFGMNFGAGAFLFSSRDDFFAVGGFDERYFAGEEFYFSLALRKRGRFKLLNDPVMTSGRKLRLYSAGKVLRSILTLAIAGPGGIRSRERLELWYGGEREEAM